MSQYDDEQIAELRKGLAPDQVPMNGTADPRNNTRLDNFRASMARFGELPQVRAAIPPLGGDPLVAMRDRLNGGAPGRQPTSFTRDLEDQPQHVELKPLAAGPELTLPETPTLAGMRAPPKASGGYGSGGGGGMAGLASAFRQAQTNQLGTLNAQQDLVERGGELAGERIDATAHLAELNSARKQRDAEVLAEHQAKVQEKHDAFLARNQQLADEIGSEKIDPSRVFADKGMGEKVSLMIAGALSGFAGQGPQFMQRMDNMISEGVKAQMANVDNKKAKLQARQNLFGQMMAESGDRRTAELQTKQLMWEAAKQEMDARASRLGIPEVTNNADQHRNAIEADRINPLRVQMTGAALQAAQAQAAAAAAAQRASEHEAWTRAMQVGDMGLKRDELQLKRDQFDAENGKDGTGLGKAGREAMALEQAKTQQELNANLKAVSSADPAKVTAGGVVGEVYSHYPTFLPGVTGARENVNAREQYNSLVRPGVGAAWKMRTGGVEPKNPTILEEQAKAYMVQPSDSEEVAKDRMARFRQHMIESAEAKGATAPGMPDSVTKR